LPAAPGRRGFTFPRLPQTRGSLAREADDREMLATVTHVGAYAAVSRCEHENEALVHKSVMLHCDIGDVSGAGWH
jgi:hypothetical protein